MEVSMSEFNGRPDPRQQTLSDMIGTRKGLRSSSKPDSISLPPKAAQRIPNIDRNNSGRKRKPYYI
jgi:hypothetical protein